MFYDERPAGPFLRALVDRFWIVQTDPDDPPSPSPVLPDGHVEVMVHVGEPFAEVGPSGHEHAQAAVLLGSQITEAARLVTRPAALVAGARLRPFAGALLTGTPQHLLTGRIHDLAGIDRPLAARIRRHLAGRTDPADVMGAFETVLTAVFAERIKSSRFVPPPGLARAVAMSVRSAGLVRVPDLASTAGVSERQLERQFATHVGLPPKTLLRILRFQQVMAALRGPSVGDWPDMAARHGFYDQAHFINDFKRFTGETPGAWQIDDRSLTAVFAGRPELETD